MLLSETYRWGKMISWNIGLCICELIAQHGEAVGSQIIYIAINTSTAVTGMYVNVKPKVPITFSFYKTKLKVAPLS